MTYHPNWTALVDGRREPTVMLSPGFVGVRVSPGRHEVEMRYEPGSGKAVLLCLGALLLGLASLAERRGLTVRARSASPRPSRGCATEPAWVTRGDGADGSRASCSSSSPCPSARRS